MAGGGRGPCGCRDCDDEPCVFHEEFNDGSTRFMWEEIDTGAGPPEFSTLIQTGFMNLTGTGSATAIALMTDDHETIYVEALPHTPAMGTEAGVTVRRSDSTDSLSFWWLGGTSYELRKGTTVLESVVGPGAGSIKLEIVSPRAGTTDVNCYVDGALVHTEAGVAFDLPDVLNLGMASIGAAAFDWFESSPCPKSCHSSPCDTICEEAYNSLCSEAAASIPSGLDLPNIPVSWEMDIEVTGTEGGGQCCSRYGGRIPFTNADYIKALGITEQWGPHPDMFGDPSTCVWHGIISSKYPGPDDSPLTPRPPIPDGFFPWWGPGSCLRADGDESPNTTTDIRWRVAIQYRGAGTLPEDFEFRLDLQLNDFSGGVTIARYFSPWQTLDVVDFTDSPTVVTLFNTPACGFPATITLTPNGNREVAGEVTQCWDVDVCEPPVTPQPGQAYCMQVTLVDEADRPISYSVPMGVGFNEATGSWEWTGFVGEWEHPTCGTMPQSEYKIHCVEPAEGEPKQWVLDITTTNGTSRIPLSDDPQFGPVFDGTVNSFCPAETWDAFAIFPSVLDDTADIFGCVDTSCSVEGYCIGGVASCETGTCASNSYGNHLGATSSNPPGVASKIGSAFTGPYPIAVPAGYRVWLWKDGGGIHLGVYNGTTLIEEATPLDIDCGQGAKTFGLSDVTFACCAGFGGVVITLIPCGGPIVHV